MKASLRREGWRHVSYCFRKYDNEERNIGAQLIDGCWRLFVDGQQCGKAKSFRLIARWVRRKTYLYCLEDK